MILTRTHNNMKIYNNALKLLIITPYLFAFSGMLIIPSGDKKMAVFLIIGTLANLLYAKVNNIDIKNRLLSPYLIIIIIATIYSIFSYYYHGSSSREMRALIAISIYLATFPLKRLSRRIVIFTLLSSCIILSISSAYHNLYLGEVRWVGYMNPIPYSTICAAIAVMCYSMLLTTSFKINKYLLSICLILASFTIMIGQSRGVWLALLISLFVISITYIKRNPTTKKGIVIFLSVIAIASSCGYFIFQKEIKVKIEQTRLEIKRIESGQKYTSIGLRLQMWEAVPKLISDSIFIGSGDSHRDKLRKLRMNGEISKSLYEFNPTHYHNQFLDKQVKSGLIGLVLLLLILIYPALEQKKHQPCDKPLIYGVISLYFIASLTDVPFNHPQTLIVFLLILYPHCTEQTS